MGSIVGFESQQRCQQQSQQQEMSRKIQERKAAVDVSIIIAAFLLCYLPGWFTGLCRQFVKSPKVPAEVILVTACIFFVSSLCNPIIYSIRKREFRKRIKNIFRRIGIYSRSNEINQMEAIRAKNSKSRTNVNTDVCTSRIKQQGASHISKEDEIMEAREELE